LQRAEALHRLVFATPPGSSQYLTATLAHRSHYTTPQSLQVDKFDQARKGKGG